MDVTKDGKVTRDEFKHFVAGLVGQNYLNGFENSLVDKLWNKLGGDGDSGNSGGIPDIANEPFQPAAPPVRYGTWNGQNGFNSGFQQAAADSKCVCHNGLPCSDVPAHLCRGPDTKETNSGDKKKDSLSGYRQSKNDTGLSDSKNDTDKMTGGLRTEIQMTGDKIENEDLKILKNMMFEKMGMDIPLEKMEATNDEKIGSLAAAYRGSSDKGECASKVCKDLEEKTECGKSKIFSSGREWCYKCEKMGEKIVNGVIGDK